MLNTYGGLESSSTSVNVNRLHVSLHSQFQSQGGLDKKAAAIWSSLCVDVHNFAQNDPRIQATLKTYKLGSDGKEVFDDGRKIARAWKYVHRSAGPLGLGLGGYTSYGLEGAAGIAGVLVDRFAPYIRKHGIQLDERGLSLAVLCFGLAAAGAAPVAIGFASAAAAWETFVLVVGLLGAGMNGYAFGKAMQEK